MAPRSYKPPRASLLANLRDHFAEFLNHRSPERLGLLDPPTCVSFSTVACASKLRSFSWTSCRRLRGRAARVQTLNYAGGFAYPAISVCPTDISIRLIAIRMPSLHRSTHAAQEY